MIIYGPSLLLHCGSSEHLLRVGVGGAQTQGQGSGHRYDYGIANNNCPWPKKLDGRSSRSERVKSCQYRCYSLAGALTGFLSAAAVMACVAQAVAADAIHEPETLSNIPQSLSGECASPKDCKKAKIQRPKSRKAESCTIKCVTTCIRGGEGSPGQGPLNVRRPLVVFKQGFRTRQYCLVECSDICNLISDDGP